MATSILTSRDGARSAPDPEVPARARRRVLSAAYKLRILCEADGCRQGQLGALLRREGLYSSQLATWRKQRREGTLTALAAARAENERLARQLAAAEAIIDIQKKVSALLALSLPGDGAGRTP